MCYPSERLATLLRLPAPSGDGDTVLLGSPDILLNAELDRHGNASLALQLLGSRPHLVWYLPSLADTTAARLGPAQAARLAVMLPNPRRYERQFGPRLAAHAERVRRRMAYSQVP